MSPQRRYVTSLRPVFVALCVIATGGLVTTFAAYGSSSSVPKPNAPTKLTATATASPAVVNLTWTAPKAQTGVVIDHYVIRREAKYADANSGDGKGDTTKDPPADIAEVPAGQTSYTDDNNDVCTPPDPELTCPSPVIASTGSKTVYYTYGVHVETVEPNSRYSSGSNKATIKMPKVTNDAAPLTAPGKPTAFTFTTNPVKISFTFAAATGGISPVTYTVRRTGGDSPTEEFPFAPAAATTQSYTDTSSKLKTNETYTYKLKAIDGAGNVSSVSSASFKART